MEKYILEMKGITKTFPGVVALDDVSLKVKSGTVHALVGENGAGKSTLMKILTGVYEATSGEIYLDGRKLDLYGVKDAQEKGISIIFQEFNLINTLTVAENIFLGRYNDSQYINWKQIRTKAHELLERLGFNFDVDRIVGTLSTAEKQLVEIAKALSYNAKIIVMDEPTSSLTKKEIEMLFPIIENLRSNNIAVIYISHKLEEVFQICDVVSILRDGKIVGESDINNITRNEIIEKMVGRSLDIEYPKRNSVLGETVLEVKNLSRNTKIKDISFALRRGEVLGIAGLVGAGRTELAETIFGVHPADGGEIFIKGEKTAIRSTREAKEHSIGFVTEDRRGTGIVIDMNIPKNITITKLNAVKNRWLLDKRKEEAVASEYVDKLDIRTPSVNQILNNLSGGNQQKVVLSKWLFSDADILILDEPTRGIDVGAKYEIYCLINTLVEQGKAIIMISSELPEVLGMSDRILVMHNGTIKGELTGEDMTAENVMQIAVD
ncbi:MAG TPA: sugar ABC transporter ATP-binding protein [Clostridiales bacterium]|nr:sugar ABC transporter ATP-binding protein [Clostridiales bacterium]